MCCQTDNTKDIKRSIYRISKLNWKWNSQKRNPHPNKTFYGVDFLSWINLIL